MEDVHLVHVLKPFTDLTYKQHRVQLRQVVVLINDAVKQLPSLHAARKGGLVIQLHGGGQTEGGRLTTP